MLEEDAVEVRTLLIHSRTLRATKRAMSLFSLFFLKLAPTFVAVLLQLLRHSCGSPTALPRRSPLLSKQYVSELGMLLLQLVSVPPFQQPE